MSRKLSAALEIDKVPPRSNELETAVIGPRIVTGKQIGRAHV